MHHARSGTAHAIHLWLPHMPSASLSTDIAIVGAACRGGLYYGRIGKPTIYRRSRTLRPRSTQR
eukprot:COSAG05_NODE_385_length_10486_cov_12.944835_9_plen_64_part_00